MKFRIVLLLLLLLDLYKCFGQKHNFINYNVENGLIQSQVTSITQDHNNELWLSTFGGISLFDGTKFKNYTKKDGLNTNLIYKIIEDHKGYIWFHSRSNITQYDGYRFKDFDIKEQLIDELISTKERVWAISNGELYFFGQSDFEIDTAIGNVTTLTTDIEGKLWAASYQKGIYTYHSGKWRREIAIERADIIVFGMWFGKHSGNLYLLTNEGVKLIQNGMVASPEWMTPNTQFKIDTKVFEDSEGNVWLNLADGGVWKYNQKHWIHFNYNNGFSDDIVYDIIEDVEGNIWLGTSGSGIFKYQGNQFVYYDRHSGLPGSSITSIAQRPKFKEGVIVSLQNNNLWQITPQQITQLNLDIPSEGYQTLANDSKGNLYIGTIRSGLFKYDGTHLSKIEFDKELSGVLHLHSYKDWLWVVMKNELIGIKQDEKYTEGIPIPNLQSVYQINKDTLIIAALNGAWLYSISENKILDKEIVNGSNVLSVSSNNEHIFIGTDDLGILVLNFNYKVIDTLNTKTGLSCDFIYSLVVDAQHNLWIGTGCGIDKVTYDKEGWKVQSFGKSDGLIGVENNNFAATVERNGDIWFGTTKGLYKFNPHGLKNQNFETKIILQSIKLFSKDLPANVTFDSLMPFINIPWHPIFKAGQNHLTFTFKGILLSNPEKVKYKYQLIGIDKEPIETDQNTIIYSNLPAGEFVLKIWASNATGDWIGKPIEYGFKIEAHFYETWWFRIMVVALLACLTGVFIKFRNQQKKNKEIWELKLREEEQAYIRQRTAEDFHDEIGNKLTRINLLSTIAIQEANKQSEKVPDLLQQIQKNAQSLYHGSKDIIWSLQPYSDYLNEIFLRIQQNTQEMLKDSDVHLVDQIPTMFFEHSYHIKMSANFSRNIIMIYKEAVNNIIKHANATHVILKVSAVEGNQIMIQLMDNGKGFDTQAQDKGNGLNNMKNRGARIKIKLEIMSGVKGTNVKSTFYY